MSDAINLLAALVGHLKKYPALESTMSGINDTRDDLVVQPYPYDGQGHMVVLADWARTLADPVVRVKSMGSDGETPHLVVSGQMVGGVSVLVVTVVDPEDADLLASNIRVEAGTTFPVDLLLRLTSPVDAEAVSL